MLLRKLLCACASKPKDGPDGKGMSAAVHRLSGGVGVLKYDASVLRIVSILPILPCTPVLLASTTNATLLCKKEIKFWKK